MSAPIRRILGFSDSKSVIVDRDADPLLFEKMIRLSKISRPHIYYIGAARGDDPARRIFFEGLCKRKYVKFTPFSLYHMRTDNPEEFFKGADIIFIDGGVSRNLLALLKEWRADQALLTAYKQGTLIAGASAGISVMFDWCITDSVKSNIMPMAGMGVLKGTVCAHYDQNPLRQSVSKNFLSIEPSAFPFYGLSDGTGILFENEKFAQGFTLRQDIGLFQYLDKASEKTRPLTPLLSQFEGYSEFYSVG